MADYPILDSKQTIELLERLYVTADPHVCRELCEITMSNLLCDNVLADMAHRFHNPNTRQPVYVEGARTMIDTLLTHFDPSRGSKQMMISIIRGTFVARQELSHWKACRNRIHDYVAKTEGLQVANRLLRGLMTDEL